MEGKLSHVVFSDGETTEEHDDMVLIQVAQYGDEYWFILAEKSAEQKEKELLEETITDLQVALADIFEMIVA